MFSVKWVSRGADEFLSTTSSEWPNVGLYEDRLAAEDGARQLLKQEVRVLAIEDHAGHVVLDEAGVKKLSN